MLVTQYTKPEMSFSDVKIVYPPELKTGDLIVADMVANDIGEVWQTHQAWLDALLPAIEPIRNGRRPDDVPHHAAARRAEGHAGTPPLWSSDGDPPENAPASTRAPSVTSLIRSTGCGRSATIGNRAENRAGSKNPTASSTRAAAPR